MIIGKNILIIGGTGSLGNTLTKTYYQHNNITIFSRDENKQWMMKLKYPNVKFVIGDMRNSSVEKVIRESRPNVIIIAGALKHIDICEYNVSECIDTNIMGVRNIIETVLSLNDKSIETTLLISTDKSCSPVNVYGMSKAVAERIVTEASIKNSPTKFLCVRYGNVLNSRGSLIPKFKEIGESKEIATFQVTDERMTRFFMTLEQSVKLIDTAINYGKGGDIWIPFIESFKIMDIARYFSVLYSKPVTVIGTRPGEKIHECLINESEVHRTVEEKIEDETFFVVKPCYSKTDVRNGFKEYTSKKTSSMDSFKKLLDRM